MGNFLTAQVLEDRLIGFASDVGELGENHYMKGFFHEVLFKQIIRSSTSAALNYGEARGAGSDKDFIHKRRIVLKELRETYVGLKILLRKASIPDEYLRLINECDELVSIFVASIKTSIQNSQQI